MRITFSLGEIVGTEQRMTEDLTKVDFFRDERLVDDPYRFYEALRDMKLVRDDEPMMMLRNQGMVLGEGSEKMSKSKGNVVAPDELVAQHLDRCLPA